MTDHATKPTNMDDVVKDLMHGLITDGAHHKQYYLDQALRKLVTEEWYDQAAREFGWEGGIPS